MKFLLIVVVVAVALWMVLRTRRKPDAKSGETASNNTRAEPAAMIACAHCGVHLPREEALADPSELRYCSEAHRALGPR